jgi:intein-encoded DNA endonuclease-like protein
MGKKGTKPQGKVKIKWSSKFAYAIGLLVTDGCLYKDGRHISLTTKDIEQAENFKKCLGLSVKIGIKYSGFKGVCYHVQFGDVLFYKFLVSIGVTPAKSKTIGKIDIPDKYFFDYLRGCFDGDGCFYSYWDPRWKSSHMFYIEFASASNKHIIWLQKEIQDKIKIKGSIKPTKNQTCLILRYAKKESLEIIENMYYNPRVVCLTRKLTKVKKALIVEKKQQSNY